MKFNELDSRMRLFETAHDHCVLPGIYMVARIDGRSFTRLTKETHAFEAPFDVRVRDMMVDTTRYLMSDVGARILYGYCQSDEISLLFHRDDQTFGRKLRKLVSVLAAEASAKFSTLLGDFAAFDCRISQLTTLELIFDYFKWRQEDAHRNSLSAHCYWRLRSEGLSPTQVTRRLAGLSVAEKNELLYSRGTNFNELPAWQRRGVGVHWQSFEKLGEDPRSGELIRAERRALTTEFELPIKDAYGDFVANLVLGSEQARRE